MNVPRPQIRCAVYTRKSSEEGLDQSFNSLDAQREACEAYILSQKHEGWRALACRYDDGGFSGGTMERPGLKQLLSDIAAGRVDTVVVYKVDRLTRSLADFAKIVESFDGKGVSFVSVTQQFNTTTSMGRLTLNVLLSFAQFEREVTGERIRDKVAASKRKGMWMGGLVPLGYDRGNRELVLNESEAEQVREIFRQYLRLGSVFDLQQYLQTTHIRSKRWVSSTGRVWGGCVLSRGTLYHLLNSKLYIGKTVHKGKVHEGLHPRIIEQDLWDQVAARLKSAQVRRHRPHNLPSRRLLTGLLFTDAGERYVPTHCSKKGRRYFYYTCATAVAAVARLPAPGLEAVVVARIQGLLRDPIALRELYKKQPVSELRLIVTAGQHGAELLEDCDSKEAHGLVRDVISRVTVTETMAQVQVETGSLLNKLLAGKYNGERDSPPLLLDCQFQSRKRGLAVRVVLEPTQSAGPEQVPLLTRAVARARDWADRIVAGELSSIDGIVRYSKLDKRYVQRILRCAALSPVMIQTILDRDQPAGTSLWDIAGHLPLEWERQAFKRATDRE